MTPNQIRQARMRMGMTFTEFAKAVRVHHRTVRRWEKGETKPIGSVALVIKRLLEDKGYE